MEPIIKGALFEALEGETWTDIKEYTAIMQALYRQPNSKLLFKGHCPGPKMALTMLKKFRFNTEWGRNLGEDYEWLFDYELEAELALDGPFNQKLKFKFYE